MFNEIKVAQMAAYLLQKRGGRMAYIKLMKLLYLADREYMILYGNSMSGDQAVSMKNGPVLSQTYDLLKGGAPEDASAWDEWISGESNYEVSIKKPVHGFDVEDVYDELSRANCRVLDRVFAEYGHYTRFQLCDLTHQICPEWQDPHGSSAPINPKSIFIVSGKSEEEAEALVANMRERHELQVFSAQLS